MSIIYVIYKKTTIQEQGRLYMNEGSAFTPAYFPSSMLFPCQFQLPTYFRGHNNPPIPEQTSLLEVENGQIQRALKGQERLQRDMRRWGLAETYFQGTNF